MRIQGGEFKGKRLSFRPKRGLRPTTSKVKGAIFNILKGRVARSAFLDLFAGTGSIGLEALSRGAELVVFVEKSPRNARIIKKNLEGSNLKGLVLEMEVFQGIKYLERQNMAFDIIFLDPPYEKGFVDSTLMTLSGGGCLMKGAIILAERSRREEISPPSSFELIREYRYGDTILSLLKWKGE